MVDHAVLVLPSANRVYAQAAPALLAAELAALDDIALGGRLRDIAVTELAGVPYVTFSGDLDAAALAVVSNLSTRYAIFERDVDALRPVAPTPLDRWDDDLVTIQRYPGKTNEQLTRLVLNLTIAASSGADAFTGAVRPRVLDPLCGRGTTLNTAVLCGLDAAGLDQDRKDVDAYLQFFTTWLKDKRAKHTSRRTGVRTLLTFAADKDARKKGHGQEVVIAADDTTRAVEHLGKSSVDAVVADLPYGVQHDSSGAADLLTAALPAWRSVLRAGGAMGLSWNTRVLSRVALVEAVGDAGFQVLDGEAFGRFGHRVDQSIQRDILIARR